jgi:hypothetical protein
MVWRKILKPYIGVTKAGTQRVVYASKFSWYITYNPNNKTTEQIEDEIIENTIIPYLKELKKDKKTFKIKSWHTYL